MLRPRPAIWGNAYAKARCQSRYNLPEIDVLLSADPQPVLGTYSIPRSDGCPRGHDVINTDNTSVSMFIYMEHAYKPGSKCSQTERLTPVEGDVAVKSKSFTKGCLGYCSIAELL